MHMCLCKLTIRQFIRLALPAVHCVPSQALLEPCQYWQLTPPAAAVANRDSFTRNTCTTHLAPTPKLLYCPFYENNM
jgi:hypothetical protein